MGNNIDFIYLCGAPEKIRCPFCKKIIPSELDEWDIDCGTERINNDFICSTTCSECEEEFVIVIKLSSKVFVNDKEVGSFVCSECGGELESEEEIEFKQCDKCCAWKYRENSK